MFCFLLAWKLTLFPPSHSFTHDHSTFHPAAAERPNDRPTKPNQIENFSHLSGGSSHRTLVFVRANTSVAFSINRRVLFALSQLNEVSSVCLGRYLWRSCSGRSFVLGSRNGLNEMGPPRVVGTLFEQDAYTILSLYPSSTTPSLRVLFHLQSVTGTNCTPTLLPFPLPGSGMSQGMCVH